MNQLIKMFIILMLKAVKCKDADALLVETLTGNVEDNCSIYPVCSDYGTGTHQILEDCRKYFVCELDVDGSSYIQKNMVCPGDLVYTHKLGKCGDPNLAKECTDFENLKCKDECPRIYFSSSGVSSSTQSESLGCFRLSGSKDLNRAAFYENSHKMTLTPYPARIWVSWFISPNPKCPYSGIMVNEREKYTQCPRSNWQGWEVKTGGGMDIVTQCLSGDAGVETSSTSTTLTTSTLLTTASTEQFTTHPTTDTTTDPTTDPPTDPPTIPTTESPTYPTTDPTTNPPFPTTDINDQCVRDDGSVVPECWVDPNNKAPYYIIHSSSKWPTRN